MTIQNIINKIIARWWLVLIFFLISLAVFFPNLSSHYYKASIGLGANFNSPAFIRSGIQTSSQYVEGMDELSRYLSARFSSVEVQMRINQEAELGLTNFQATTPFYEITRQGGGYISITFDSSKKEKAEKFLEVVKNVYSEIITTEMSGDHVLVDFQIKPQEDFFSHISEVRKPLQLKILPILVGLLAGLFVAIILPYKSEAQIKPEVEKESEVEKTESKVSNPNKKKKNK